MSQRTDIGMRAVDTIREIWQIDKNRTVETENGFDWWPGHFKQSIVVSEAVDFMGVPSYKLEASTELLKNFSIDDFEQSIMLDFLARTSPSYAVRTAPLGASVGVGLVDLFSTAYVNEENSGWIPRFFSQLALLQPIDAQVKAPLFESMGELELATSTPLSGNTLLELDEVLSVGEHIYVPAGKEDSRWKGSDEFETFTKKYGRQDSCFGMGDASGMTLEIPFGEDSALIRLLTSQPHPALGNGLLATIQLPWFPGETEALNSVIQFNVLESISHTGFPMLGSWAKHEARDAVGVAFSCFIPNALYQPNIATNLAFWMVARVRWIKEKMWADLEDLTMEKILKNRFDDPSHLA
jgi:hypothetical protein